MLEKYQRHNSFKVNSNKFNELDPHLSALSHLQHQHSPSWWKTLSLDTPGIYTITGGRQIGKSTSCKMLLAECVKTKRFPAEHMLYLPCDEIADAKEFSQILRFFLDQTNNQPFLLIIDEVTFVKQWDRSIKALADEGWFNQGLCLLTGSDTLILKEAAMSFPGRRGQANTTDFHLFPLTFKEYTELITGKSKHSNEAYQNHFNDYLQCGGYLRAINDFAKHGAVQPATLQTYEQWIRGDFLKRGKNEAYLLSTLGALLKVGVSQISYSGLTQNIGLLSKETLLEYCHLLERMDILINLQAYDQNKKLGFPRKARKFHLTDPFIQRTIYQWLLREGYVSEFEFEGHLVEACVASHCNRLGKTYYFKGQGEVDVIWLHNKNTYAIEVKWANQLRPSDLKTLKQFNNSSILSKKQQAGNVDGISVIPVYQFLMQLGE